MKITCLLISSHQKEGEQQVQRLYVRLTKKNKNKKMKYLGIIHH